MKTKHKSFVLASLREAQYHQRVVENKKRKAQLKPKYKNW